MSFFGIEFLKYKLVLICLSTIQLINVFFGPTILVASYCPSRSSIAKKIIISIFPLLAISYFLIKTFGLYGGVASNLISVLVINALINVHIRKYYKLKLNSF